MTTEKNKKIAEGAGLPVYGLVSGLSCFFLAGRGPLGSLLFVLIQAGFILRIGPKSGRWFLIPVTLLFLGSVLNDCPIWRPWNVIVSLLLYSAACTGPDLRREGWDFAGNCLRGLSRPFMFLTLPFRRLAELSGGNSSVVKRVLTALAIACPAVLVLLALLSRADTVFSVGLGNLLSGLIRAVNLTTFFRLIISVFAALYLFGFLCAALEGPWTDNRPQAEKKTDLLIVDIIFCCILAVYTIFCIIQFRYLFCGAKLPYNLSYTNYARRGFFELLGLSGANLLLILFTVRRRSSGSSYRLAKWLCAYLCAVTGVLLASSFYRMLLYCGSDGLTRLRFFVLGFLIFEALGLIATAVYIFKPVFNPGLVYLGLGLVYYVLLNLVPADYFVAKSQVDMYLSGRRDEISYALTLSADAAPQLARVAGHGDRHIINTYGTFDADGHYIPFLDNYFDRIAPGGDWREFNLARYRAAKIKY